MAATVPAARDVGIHEGHKAIRAGYGRTQSQRSEVMTHVRRCIQVALATLSVSFAAALVSSAPALAGHTFSSSFGTFSEPLGVAIDESGGPSAEDIYVADYHGGTEGQVAKFNSTGTSELLTIPVESPYGVAVDKSNGDVYVANNVGGAVEVFSESGGSPISSFETPATTPYEPAGIALNPTNGDVYVTDLHNNLVDVFSAAGKYEKQFSSEGPTPVAIAIDSAGNVYVANSGTDVVEFTSAGACVNSCTPINNEGAQSVAVDPVTNEVYVDDATSIKVYPQSSNVLKEEFGSGELGFSLGLAIDGGSNTVYASDHGEGHNDTAIYVPGVVVPEQPLTVKVEPASAGVVECEDVTANPGHKELCKAKYHEGDEVALTQTPNPGYEFTPGWEGKCSGTGACAVTMSEPVSVTAKYTKMVLPKHPLEVEVKGDGEVTGGTIACTTGNTGTCSEEVEELENVKLTETPATGWAFVKWSVSGAACVGGATSATCEFAMPGTPVTVEAEFVETHEFPLTLFIAGQGEITSTSGGGFACSAEECVHPFAGEVTLTVAQAGSGYEFVGWLGCKKTSSTTCKVNMTAATEVTAVFLKAGSTGATGPTGPIGPIGPTGPKGATGSPGAAGTNGTNGEKGANGSAGPAGAQGPTGPAGAQGPAGQIELVKCKKAGKKQKCTTKLVSGTVKFTATKSSAHATLSRHGAVYAAGTESSTNGNMSLRLTPLRKLRPGRYTLTLISGSGKHENIRSESFTLG